RETDKPLDDVLDGSSKRDENLVDASSSSVPNEVIATNDAMVEGALMISDDCSDFIWFKSGAMMEFEAKDKGDKVIHRSKMLVSKIYSQGGATVADVITSDNMGNEFTLQFKCAGDKLYMDFAAAMEAAMKESGNDTEANAEQIKTIRENTEMNFS